jgi:hypothetical protein
VERCTSCQYFDRQNKAQSVGQCRRQAPALSPINVKAYMIEGVWPTVRDDDWCGEFRAQVRRGDTRDLMSAVVPHLAPQAVPTMRVATLPPAGAVPVALAIGAAHRGND